MTVPVPSRKWPVIRLRWLARPFVGDPRPGVLSLQIDQRAPLLYDDPAAPVSVFTARTETPLTTITANGTKYSYVEVDVPASDDPDIGGDLFTYTATIRLDDGTAYGPFTFTVPADAPGGELWLATTVGVKPAPCELLPQITLAAFRALTARVDALDGG